MSTVFDVPCPDCGLRMSVGVAGDLHCSTCRQAYQLRMGHLFPLGERTPSPRAAEAASPGVPAS